MITSLKRRLHPLVTYFKVREVPTGLSVSQELPDSLSLFNRLEFTLLIIIKTT